MKKLLNYIYAGSLLLAGCDRTTEVTTELSDLLTEDSLVAERIHTPAYTTTVPAITYDVWNDEFKLTTEDKLIPDNYKVSFSKGEDHIFVQEGSNVKYKNLYESLKEGDKVKVYFRKVYRATYDLTKAEKQLSKKELKDYEFIDAKKVEHN